MASCQGDNPRITVHGCQAAPFGHGAASKTFYVGKMQVGNMEHSQELQVGSVDEPFLISIDFQLFIFSPPWPIGPSTISPSKVAFETASGSMVLDSTHCQSPACMKHRQYMPTKTSAQLNRAGGVDPTGRGGG